MSYLHTYLPPRLQSTECRRQVRSILYSRGGILRTVQYSSEVNLTISSYTPSYNPHTVPPVLAPSIAPGYHPTTIVIFLPMPSDSNRLRDAGHGMQDLTNSR
jgi:hypothetical protein